MKLKQFILKNELQSIRTRIVHSSMASMFYLDSRLEYDMYKEKIRFLAICTKGKASICEAAVNRILAVKGLTAYVRSATYSRGDASFLFDAVDLSCVARLRDIVRTKGITDKYYCLSTERRKIINRIDKNTLPF